jgi:hypothetical protein
MPGAEAKRRHVGALTWDRMANMLAAIDQIFKQVIALTTPYSDPAAR